jgi:hypothetical protein
MQLFLTYLLLLFYQERIHDFQSPVLLNMKCIAHVMSKQDQWTFIYVVILFLPRYWNFSWTFHAYVMLRYCKFSWTFHSCLIPRYWKFSWTFHAYVMLCYCKFNWTVSSLELSTHASCYATVSSLEHSMRTPCYATLSSLELSTHASC